MEAAFKIPSDLQLLGQFRDLAAVLGSESKAVHVWYILWQEFNSRANAGERVGRLHKQSVPSFLRALTPVVSEPERCSELFEEGLVKTGLIQVDGDGYVCPRFIMLNSQAGRGGKESLGGHRKAYLRRQESINTGSYMQARLIDPEKFLDLDGKPMTGEQTQRVIWLIRSVDNALYLPDRQPMDYSKGLIEGAQRVLAAHVDDEINCICNDLSLHREHPYLNGMSAEKLFLEFGTITTKLN